MTLDWERENHMKVGGRSRPPAEVRLKAGYQQQNRKILPNSPQVAQQEGLTNWKEVSRDSALNSPEQLGAAGE